MWCVPVSQLVTMHVVRFLSTTVIPFFFTIWSRSLLKWFSSILHPAATRSLWAHLNHTTATSVSSSRGCGLHWKRFGCATLVNISHCSLYNHFQLVLNFIVHYGYQTHRRTWHYWSEINNNNDLFLANAGIRPHKLSPILTRFFWEISSVRPKMYTLGMNRASGMPHNTPRSRKPEFLVYPHQA